MNNNQISIVAISDIKIKQTIFALIESSKSIMPLQTILFTSKSIKLSKNESSLVTLIKINPISSIEDYSNFLIYNLHKYLKTSHALIVQWDGYIYNKNKWDKNFLKYDYIGAPFIPRFFDEDYSRDLDGGFHVIGNGGFSLRSRKLLEAPSRFKLKDENNFTNSHEDGFFSVLHRKFLESKGFKWAPYDIAKKFSIETPISRKDLILLPFGFHGKKMLLIVKIFRKFRRFIEFLRLF